MIPPILGAMILIGTLAVVGLGLTAIVIGLVRSQPAWTRLGAIVATLGVAGWAIVWVIGLATGPRRSLSRGEELHFCGVDCHLHISVVRATRDTDIGVVLRFRSDAKSADEFPGLLRYVVVDSAGRPYLPASGIIAEPLPAGETIEREFRFSVPPEARRPQLRIYWPGKLDYLVPGRANPLVQQRVELSLGVGDGP